MRKAHIFVFIVAALENYISQMLAGNSLHAKYERALDCYEKDEKLADDLIATLESK